MVDYNKSEIREALTLENVFDLLQDWNRESRSLYTPGLRPNLATIQKYYRVLKLLVSLICRKLPFITPRILLRKCLISRTVL